MKKSLQITGIAGIIAIAAVFGIFASNMDTAPEMGRASLANLDLEDQMNKVDYAIIGVVKEVIQPYPDRNGNPDIPRYFGDVIITVEEVLKGEIIEKEITIRTQANIREEVTFTDGERALLFLVAGEPGSVEGEGVYVVSGMYQGKYTITDGIAQDPKYEDKTYIESDLRTQIISNRG